MTERKCTFVQWLIIYLCFNLRVSNTPVTTRRRRMVGIMCCVVRKMLRIQLNRYIFVFIIYLNKERNHKRWTLNLITGRKVYADGGCTYAFKYMHYTCHATNNPEFIKKLISFTWNTAVSYRRIKRKVEENISVFHHL